MIFHKSYGHVDPARVCICGKGYPLQVKRPVVVNTEGGAKNLVFCNQLALALEFPHYNVLNTDY